MKPLKTIEDLERLERLMYARGLYGKPITETVRDEFERTKFAEPPPLYAPLKGHSKVRKFFEYAYEQLSYSELTGRGTKETFENWLGSEFIEKHLS